MKFFIITILLGHCKVDSSLLLIESLKSAKRFHTSDARFCKKSKKSKKFCFVDFRLKPTKHIDYAIKNLLK